MTRPISSGGTMVREAMAASTAPNGQMAAMSPMPQAEGVPVPVCTASPTPTRPKRPTAAIVRFVFNFMGLHPHLAAVFHHRAPELAGCLGRHHHDAPPRTAGKGPVHERRALELALAAAVARVAVHHRMAVDEGQRVEGAGVLADRAALTFCTTATPSFSAVSSKDLSAPVGHTSMHFAAKIAVALVKSSTGVRARRKPSPTEATATAPVGHTLRQRSHLRQAAARARSSWPPGGRNSSPSPAKATPAPPTPAPTAQTAARPTKLRRVMAVMTPPRLPRRMECPRRRHPRPGESHPLRHRGRAPRRPRRRRPPPTPRTRASSGRHRGRNRSRRTRPRPRTEPAASSADGARRSCGPATPRPPATPRHPHQGPRSRGPRGLRRTAARSRDGLRGSCCRQADRGRPAGSRSPRRRGHPA